MKIACITGSPEEPSSRYRIRQYIPSLNKVGFDLVDYPSVIGRYPPAGFKNRIIWIMKIMIERFSQVVKINKCNYDCVILQREMVSTLHTFERYINAKVILDVDDAIYLHKGGHFIKKIAKKSNAVICGNTFLAEKFSAWNKNVHIIPTAVDTDKFIPKQFSHDYSKQKITIGWVGTSGGFRYLNLIENAIHHILSKHENIEFLVISNEKPRFKIIENFQYIKWSPEDEVENFQKLDIGIMPLENDEWTKGKCSYKMLQYMSCGIPVVVSAVGMNNEVLLKGNIGFGASDYLNDWVLYLSKLVQDSNLRETMGSNGRDVVEQHYSIKVLSHSFSNIIQEIKKESKK